MPLKKYSKERIESLLPDVQKIFNRVIELAQAAGLDVQVSCGYRTPEEQNELYKIGRTKPGKIVTNAKAWQSAHQYKIAADLFFIIKDKDGKEKAEWNLAKYKKVWTACVKDGLDKKGLIWGGNWTSFKDNPHFQVGSIPKSKPKTAATTALVEDPDPNGPQN